jgi:hypothetical protein
VSGAGDVAPLEVLVLAERLPLGSTAGFRMVSALSSRVEGVRLTVGAVAAEQSEVDRLTADGVEVVVDPSPRWIDERSARVTVVLVEGAAAAQRYGGSLLASQPQAAIVYDPTGEAPDDHLAGRASEVAVLSRAHVVLAPSVGYGRFAAEIAPQAHIVGAEPGTPRLDRALAQALALTGVAVPDAAFA